VRPLHAALARALAILAIAGASGAAQAPAERAALQLFRDSLDVTTDTIRLHGLEARGTDAARAHRDDPLLHLRLGFLALRIGELGGGASRVDAAISEFEWAAELRPDWPYPWFGLGLAEARAPDRVAGFAGGLWAMLGIDRDTRAGTAFARALKADPGFVDGLVAFAETARNQRIGAPLKAALDALRLAQASPLGWEPALLLERGRLERLAGSADSARVAFRRAVLLGFRPAMASLELARTLPLTSDTFIAARGQQLPVEIAYYRGAASDEREVVAMYRRDLAPIVDDSTLAQFDRVTGEGRVAWLREFWRTRGAADMRSAGARLSEHFRRWDLAVRSFRLPPFRRSYRWGIETWQSHDTDLDDRGIILLRQGTPTARIVWPTSQPRIPGPTHAAPILRTVAGSDAVIVDSNSMYRASPVAGSLIINPTVGDEPTFGNETWRYARPDGDLVLNFTAHDDPDDYRLVESILQLDVSFDAMLERSADLPGLAELLRAGPMSRVGMETEERLKGKRSIGEATTTSSWARSYPITMGGRVQWLVAGTRDGKSLVHIVYGMDAALVSRLQVDRRSGLVPIVVRAVFLDSQGRAVASLDTVQLMQPPHSATGLVAARAELPVPPGTHKIRLNVEANRAIGTLYPLDTLVVPDVRSGPLALSSIILGIAGRSLPWVVTPGDTAWLAPHSNFLSRDTLSLFLESYGLLPGVNYTVHIGVTRERGALVRLLKGHRESVTLTEHFTASGATGQIRRALALQGLEPGNYRLQVVVEAPGVKPVMRQRSLVIEKTGG